MVEIVSRNVCADEANKKFGERYGVDWVYESLNPDRLQKLAPKMYEMLRILVDDSNNYADERGITETFYQNLIKAEKLIKEATTI